MGWYPKLMRMFSRYWWVRSPRSCMPQMPMMRLSMRGVVPMLTVAQQSLRAVRLILRTCCSRLAEVAIEREAMTASTQDSPTPNSSQSSSQAIFFTSIPSSRRDSIAWRSCPSIPSLKSAAITIWPAWASGMARCPAPHPISRTDSPGCSPARWRKSFTYALGASLTVKFAARASHALLSEGISGVLVSLRYSSSQSRLCRTLGASWVFMQLPSLA